MYVRYNIIYSQSSKPILSLLPTPKKNKIRPVHPCGGFRPSRRGNKRRSHQVLTPVLYGAHCVLLEAVIIIRFVLHQSDIARSASVILWLISFF